ncbi:MAG: hypothetical protein JWP91_3145 [Fibrobacteres bacterium]|nr:hypothetical protein [Fibrobacterota bacterium]
MNIRTGLSTLLIFLAVSAHADKLKDHLSVFFDMEPQDSVVALEQKSPTLLWVTVADPASGKTRVLKEEVGAKPMEKLLMESNDLGLKTLHLSSTDDAAPAAGADRNGSSRPSESAAPKVTGTVPSEAGAGRPPINGKTPHSLSSQTKNRMYYMTTQTIASTYVYGIALPSAYDNVSTKARIATPMIVAPFAFGANFYFAKNRPFEDSHLKGTSYLSMAALYASHALPFTILDWDNNPYRVASFLSMAAYPAGIYAGYKLGDKYVDLPGRIDIQSKFALGFGLLGFFTPFLYFQHIEDHDEAVIKLGLGQSLVLATGGHFLADHYRTGENIPDGVNTGIMDHTALGALAGLEIAALSDASTVRPWLGTALLGGTVGFMEGLWYYQKSYDSKERGLYNSLGALAGTLMGGGIAFLAIDDKDSDYKIKAMLTSLLVGGTWFGYCATNLLTDGMEDRTASRKETWIDHLAFNPIPMPEPTTRDREVYMRYRVQGVTYRF